MSKRHLLFGLKLQILDLYVFFVDFRIIDTRIHNKIELCIGNGDDNLCTSIHSFYVRHRE